MADARTDTDVMAPIDLSHFCDGERMDFPIEMEVDAIKVMLNDVYLEEGLDFLLHRRGGGTHVSLRRTPARGDRLIVLRVPREPRPAAQEAKGQARLTWRVDLPYEQLPQLVKDNLSSEQWVEAQRGVVLEGAAVPETTDYINLKNAQIHAYQIGQPAEGPLLPVHDLAGGRGKDSAQFRSAPPGAHGVP